MGKTHYKWVIFHSYVTNYQIQLDTITSPFVALERNNESWVECIGSMHQKAQSKIMGN